MVEILPLVLMYLVYSRSNSTVNKKFENHCMSLENEMHMAGQALADLM